MISILKNINVQSTNKILTSNYSFWTMINGSKNTSRENRISVIQDCFKTDHFKTMSIRIWGKSYLPPHFEASIDFQCNKTSGSQTFKANSLAELMQQLEAFSYELENKNKTK